MKGIRTDSQHYPPGHHERIALYTERAALGLPLFGDSDDPRGLPIPPLEDDLLSRAEAAAILDVDPRTVGVLGVRGKLTRVQCGYSCVRYRRSEVEALKEQM